MVSFCNYFNLKYTIFTETLVLFFSGRKEPVLRESRRYLNLKIGLLISAWGYSITWSVFSSTSTIRYSFTRIYVIYVNICVVDDFIVLNCLICTLSLANFH